MTASPGERIALRRVAAADAPAAGDSADYAELKRLVVGANLLARQPGYCTLNFATTGLMAAVGLAVLLRARDLPAWASLLNAV